MVKTWYECVSFRHYTRAYIFICMYIYVHNTYTYTRQATRLKCYMLNVCLLHSPSSSKSHCAVAYAVACQLGYRAQGQVVETYSLWHPHVCDAFETSICKTPIHIWACATYIKHLDHWQFRALLSTHIAFYLCVCMIACFHDYSTTSRRVCMVWISTSSCMHVHHGVCVLKHCPQVTTCMK